MDKYTVLLSHSKRDVKKLFEENNNFGFKDYKIISEPFSIKELPSDFDSCSVLIQDNEMLWWELDIKDDYPETTYKDAFKKLIPTNYCTILRVSK